MNKFIYTILFINTEYNYLIGESIVRVSIDSSSFEELTAKILKFNPYFQKIFIHKRRFCILKCEISKEDKNYLIVKQILDVEKYMNYFNKLKILI